MEIRLEDIGKRFGTEWIFRQLDYRFTSENSYVILGSNGSGKSTLLQLIAGNITPTEGEVHYENSEGSIENEKVFRQLSFAAHYLELPEEFNLSETLNFHSDFKPFISGFSVKDITEILKLGKTTTKQLKDYSSGMKQRVKLALAILSDTSLLLLDEPTGNLDKSGIKWYHELIESYARNRLVIVCSNHQEEEYVFCNQQLTLEDYKS